MDLRTAHVGGFPERRGASGRLRRAVTPTAASRAQLRTEAREAQRAGGQRAYGMAASIMPRVRAAESYVDHSLDEDADVLPSGGDRPKRRERGPAMAGA